MTYCRKCGAKLDEGARFCRVCGTPVEPIAVSAKPEAPARAGAYPRRTGFPLAIIAIVIVVALVLVAIVAAFFPFKQVSFSQANQASAGNVDTLRLNLTADVATVNLMLKDLPGNQLATANVSATGWRGLIGTDQPITLVFNQKTEGSTLVYSVRISRAGLSAFTNLDVVCDIYLDPSYDLDVTVNTDTGAITLDADKQATFQNLVLKATTGRVEAKVLEDVEFAGNLSLETTTGTVQLLWDEAKAAGNVQVNAKTTTGSVDVNITQTRQLGGNVTLTAGTTTGGATFAINIQNDIGAKISASTALGGVDVVQEGFSGNKSPLQSNNYPAINNFEVTLGTTTGGININAIYALGGTRT